jgi:hypothetical protein
LPKYVTCYNRICCFGFHLITTTTQCIQQRVCSVFKCPREAPRNICLASAVTIDLFLSDGNGHVRVCNSGASHLKGALQLKQLDLVAIGRPLQEWKRCRKRQMYRPCPQQMTAHTVLASVLLPRQLSKGPPLYDDGKRITLMLTASLAKSRTLHDCQLSADSYSVHQLTRDPLPFFHATMT